MSESRQQSLAEAGKTEGPYRGASLPTAHTFDAAWKQPEDIDRILRQATADCYTLNVCAGESPLGDVKVDAAPQQPDAIPADMNRLPFEDNTFEAAIVDPPWNLNYFRRQKPLFEPIRVVEPDGVVFFNARWMGESEQTRIEPPLLIRADDPWGDISVLVAHRVDPDQRGLTHWGAGVDEVPTRPNPRQMINCPGCGASVPRTDAVASKSLTQPNQFCSVDCMHRVEADLGEPLTPADEPGPFPVHQVLQGIHRGED